MRTTVTLDADVERLIRAAMQREGRSFEEVLDAAVRRGLSPASTDDALPPCEVVPHVARLAPGLDRRSLDRLADTLEDEALLVAEPDP